MQEKKLLEDIKDSIEHLGTNFSVEYSRFHEKFITKEELEVAVTKIDSRLKVMHRDIQEDKQHTKEVADQTKIANGRTRALEDKTLKHDNDIEQLNLIVSKFYELVNSEKKSREKIKRDWVVWGIKKAITAILLLISWLLIASGILNIPN